MGFEIRGGTWIIFGNRNFEFFQILIILHPQPQKCAMEVMVAEISMIWSEIRNLNFRWESRIRQFREVDGQRRSYVLIIPTLVDVPKGRHRSILSKFSFRMWSILYHNLKEKSQFKVTYGDICICHLKFSFLLTSTSRSWRPLSTTLPYRRFPPPKDWC